MGCCCIKGESDTYEAAKSAPPSELSELSVVTSGPIYSDRECLICLDESATKDWEWTPCSHGFHSSCLRKWLQVRPVCPMCFTYAFTEEEAAEEEEVEAVDVDV